MSPGDLGEAVKPFVFLDFFDADSRMPGQMPYHPHSGIVTVTTLFEGAIRYEDSTGQAGVLPPGSVEWMKAGSGVWHSGDACRDAGPRIRGMQLWFALARKLENTAPQSIYLDPERVPEQGPARLVLGEYQGMTSSLPPLAPMTYLHVQLKARQSWSFECPRDHDVLWLAIDQGCISVAGEPLSGEMAVVEHAAAQSLPITANTDANFVIGSAQRHPYPLCTGYYSVHTSEQALRIGESGIAAIGRKLRAAGKLLRNR